MSYNLTRRINRLKMKEIVSDFKKQYKYTDQQLAGLCLATFKSVSLKNKYNAIMKVMIEQMEAQLKDKEAA